MLPRRATVDACESEIPTPRQPDSDRESTVVARHAPVEESAIFARGRRSSALSERALYVPSALPMCELKKNLARADLEATLTSSADDTSKVKAYAAADDAPPSSAPTRLHRHREATPFELAQTSLDRGEHRRLSSNVDAEEEKANAGWRYPVPPLPALEEFAPIVGAPIALPVPGVSLAATTSAIPSAKRGGVGAALYVATLLVAGAIGICIVRGDLTRDDARGAAAAVARAASHVVDSVKGL